ncbi:hypothetical protein JCM1840_001497 [Sporobolomyces johnsonii]
MVPHVAAAYEALPGPGDYEAVRKDIERQLPLRNLHWVRKNAAHRSIRTIQTLSVDFRPLTTFPDGGIGASLLSRPYLHLLFVVCDDNEVYRATIRSQIREWLDGVIAKQHQEWLIVHVTTGKGSGAKFYQRKSAIVDKIKADFNTGKKDRCIQVAQGASADDPTAWAEFSNKVKEGVIATFDSNVGLYEENVRKADSQRQLEGWHFLPFFLQKEALADSFEAMTLYEEALIQYDELEASFFQNIKEHNIAWFDNVGGLAPGDDALPLLLTDNKPYRKLIESNSISVFDFRIYLFARQAAMLFHLGRIVEVARRGAYFVSTFARKLREHQNSLGQNFVESWTYSAALNIVEECEQRLNQDMPGTAVTSFVAVKAELLELAKKQLDKIGMGAGHLPMVHPFSMSLNEIIPTSSSAPSPPNRPPVSRKDLLNAISKQEVFDKLYVDLTHRTIQAYQASGRKRCSIKLHAGLAALENHRSRPTSAQKLFSQLPAHYADLRWVSIESFLLNQCTRLQSQLDMPKERLLSTLALVRAGIEFGSKKWELSALGDGGSGEERRVQNAKVAKQLMEDVYQLSSTLSKDFAAVAFPTFSIRLAPGSGERAMDEDGITATALVRNLLPTALDVDEVRLKFATSEGEQIWFTAGRTELQPGETPVSLFCPTASTGRLALELSQLRFSRIIFQYSHRPISSRNLAPDPRLAPVTGKQPFLYVRQDYQAVQISTEPAQAIHLDRERHAIICIDPGRNSLTKVTLRFETPASSVQLDAARARIAEAGPSVFLLTTRAQLMSALPLVADGVRLAAASDAEHVVLENLKPFSVVKVELPLVGEILEPTVKFAVVAEYCTVKRPTLRRTLRRSFAYFVGLPLAVNVQDYFREDCLLSKFSVTTDGLQGLKVKSAVIQAPTSVQVKPCRSPSAPPVAISPLQTANFLFKLRCDRPADVSDTLRLVLTYSSIQDQLHARIRGLALSVIAASSLQPHARWLVEALQHEATLASDLDRYMISEDLSHLVFEEERWRERVGKYTGVQEQREAILEAVRKIHESYRSPDRGLTPDVEASWRTLEIPLDLPSLTVLNLVSVAPSLLRAEIGQPVPATITIRSTFKWSRGGGPQQEGQGDAGSGSGSGSGSGPVRLRLGYTVVAGSQEWVVSGRTRGEFDAEEHVPVTIPVTLVPLKPTALFLPSVVIAPVLPSSSVGTTLTCETQHVGAATTVEVLPIVAQSSFEVQIDAGGGSGGGGVEVVGSS